MAKKKFNGIASLFKFRKNQDELLDIVNDKEAVISPTKQIVENFISNKMEELHLITRKAFWEITTFEGREVWK